MRRIKLTREEQATEDALLRGEYVSVSKEKFKDPPSYKVELQKTRNSKDGTNTRGYKRTEFDILAACLFNHTKRWEYLFICTPKLQVRPDARTFLKVMQPVPYAAASPWHESLETALRERVSR